MKAMTDIGKEYAAALFMLACEEKAEREYEKALKLIKEAFLSESYYEQLLSSPSIPLSQRLSAIEAAFADIVPTHVLSYLQLLCEKGRMNCFIGSVDEYCALVDAAERISKASVISAVPLTDDEKEKLKLRLEQTYNCKVNLEYSVDETLLGGLIVELDGKIMDGSVKNRLREIKEVINQ